MINSFGFKTEVLFLFRSLYSNIGCPNHVIWWRKSSISDSVEIANHYTEILFLRNPFSKPKVRKSQNNLILNILHLFSKKAFQMVQKS